MPEHRSAEFKSVVKALTELMLQEKADKAVGKAFARLKEVWDSESWQASHGSFEDWYRAEVPGATPEDIQKISDWLLIGAPQPGEQ